MVISSLDRRLSSPVSETSFFGFVVDHVQEKNRFHCFICPTNDPAAQLWKLLLSNSGPSR